MIRDGGINTATFTQDLEKIFGSDYQNTQDLASKIYVYVAKSSTGGQELHCMKKGLINGLWLKLFHEKVDYSLEEGAILRDQLGDKTQANPYPSTPKTNATTQKIFTKIFNKYDLRHKYKDDLERIKIEFEVTKDVKSSDNLLEKLSKLYNDVGNLEIGEASNDERKELQHEIVNAKVSLFRHEFESIKRAYENKNSWEMGRDYSGELQVLFEKIDESTKTYPKNKAKIQLSNDIHELWQKVK